MFSFPHYPDAQYPENLHELHNDLPFLPERIKTRKVEKLVTNLHDETEYIVHIRNLKQALNDGLILKKVHRGIKFNQKAWLKPYIDMNTKRRQKSKYNFEKDFKLTNNRNIKLATSERRKKYLVSKPNYHNTKFFTENLLAIEMRKTQILMNKPVYLDLSILDLGKNVTYEFWCDYIKPKYDQNA